MKSVYFIVLIYLIVVISMIVLVGYQLQYNVTNINKGKHAKGDNFYAHFSAVDKYNYVMFPRLLFTHPQYYTLNAGDSLYIPKNWWHWVKTSEKTTALNFWVEKIDIESEIPFYINNVKDEIGIDYGTIQAIIKGNNNSGIWNSNGGNISEMDSKSFLNGKKDDEYLITLDYFEEVAEHNIELKNEIVKRTSLPDFFKKHGKYKTDTNLWISSGKTDTGLHRDDFYGILHVIKGKKTVTLFPPEDTKYLYPYDLTPTWASSKPAVVNYNKYHFVKNLGFFDNLLGYTKSSGHLLYHMMELFDVCFDCKSVPAKLYKKSSKPFVWGLKWNANDFTVRFEYYDYVWNLEDEDTTIIDTDLLSFVPKTFLERVTANKNKSILSVDSYNIPGNAFDLEAVNTIHIYEVENHGNLPVFGKAYELTLDNDELGKENTKLESTFLYCDIDRAKTNYEEYMSRLGFTELESKSVKPLLDLYKCKEISIHLKYNKLGTKQFFMQYFDISIDDFIDFLIKCKYPKNVINYIMENKKIYANLKHEIAIIFDIFTHEIIRSGIYGIII